MRFLLLILVFFATTVTSSAQALRDLNYNYLYDPQEPISFQLHPVSGAGGWTNYFKLQLRDSLDNPNEYIIRWDLRTELSDKDGKVITADTAQYRYTKHFIEGKIFVPITGKVYLTARIQSVKKKTAWHFYQQLSDAWPVNSLVVVNAQPVLEPFVKPTTPIQITGTTSPSIITYYREPFPAGAPLFSESQARVSRGLKSDSVFQWAVGTTMPLPQKGLYLVQQDTTSTQGIAFRVENDYPRLARVESLADPLVYICTRDEFVKVKLAKGDKKAFDRVILGITGDADRAKTLFRSYFRRVELANEFFSSYKEGWKTDRGMVYIIFGLPEEVYRFDDREVWKYDQADFKLNLTFTRSSTLFDPDNFVLTRSKRHQEIWYTVIDLWRNARF